MSACAVAPSLRSVVPSGPEAGASPGPTTSHAPCHDAVRKSEAWNEEALAVCPDKGMFADGQFDGADSVVGSEDGNGRTVDDCRRPRSPGVGEDKETDAVGGDGGVDSEFTSSQ